MKKSNKSNKILVRCSAEVEEKFRLMCSATKLSYGDLLEKLIEEYEVEFNLSKK